MPLSDSIMIPSPVTNVQLWRVLKQVLLLMCFKHVAHSHNKHIYKNQWLYLCFRLSRSSSRAASTEVRTHLCSAEYAGTDCVHTGRLLRSSYCMYYIFCTMCCILHITYCIQHEQHTAYYALHPACTTILHDTYYVLHTVRATYYILCPASCMYYISHMMHCILLVLHTAYCILYIMYYILHTTYYILHTLCTAYCMYYILHITHYILHALHTMYCILHVLHTAYYILCIAYCMYYIPHVLHTTY